MIYDYPAVNDMYFQAFADVFGPAEFVSEVLTGIIDWAWSAFGPAEYDFRHLTGQLTKQEFACLWREYSGNSPLPANTIECYQVVVWFDHGMGHG